MVLEDDVNISCQYQRVEVGGLICRAANTKGSTTTSETSPEVCAECEIGRVERELGCMSIGGSIFLAKTFGGISSTAPDLWCQLRKRETSYEICQNCGCVESTHASQTVTASIDILDTAGFSNAKRALVDARTQLQQMDFDGCIRNSAVAIESTCKSILDQRNKPYPAKEQLTDLWKAVKDEIGIGSQMEDNLMIQVVGSITGTIQNLSGVRNELSDAHGKGIFSPELYRSHAELALNLSATLVTYLVRRKMEMEQK